MTDETASANEITADASADNTAAAIDLADYRSTLSTPAGAIWVVWRRPRGPVKASAAM